MKHYSMAASRILRVPEQFIEVITPHLSANYILKHIKLFILYKLYL